MRKIEDTLGLDRKTAEKDYQEIGNLRGLARKYGTSHGAVAHMFDRFGLSYNHDKTGALPVNDNYFSSLVDPNVAYWIGFLTADGCVYKNYLRLGLAEKDLSHLEKFRDDLSSSHKISTTLTAHSLHEKNWHDTVCKTLAIGSSKIVRDIEKYGLVPRKTFITKFPDCFVSGELTNIYCRGYFDGDGCWSFHQAKSRPNHKPQLTFSLRGTKEFLYIFNQVMVRGACLPARCLDRKISASGGIGSLTYVGNRIGACIARWLYADIISGIPNRYLERKFEIIKPVLDMKKIPICFGMANKKILLYVRPS
jgi:hypothetical protein